MIRILFIRDGENDDGREVAGIHLLTSSDGLSTFTGEKKTYYAEMPSPVPIKFGADGWLAKHAVIQIEQPVKGAPGFKRAGFYLLDDLDADQCAQRLGFPKGRIEELCRGQGRRQIWTLE